MDDLIEKIHQLHPHVFKKIDIISCNPNEVHKSVDPNQGRSMSLYLHGDEAGIHCRSMGTSSYPVDNKHGGKKKKYKKKRTKRKKKKTKKRKKKKTKKRKKKKTKKRKKKKKKKK